MTLEEQIRECELEIKDLTIRAQLAEKENKELKKELELYKGVVRLSDHLRKERAKGEKTDL